MRRLATGQQKLRACKGIKVSSDFAAIFEVVLEEGIEPTRPCGHRILSPARLPVPPLELKRLWQVSMPPRSRSSQLYAG